MSWYVSLVESRLTGHWSLSVTSDRLLLSNIADCHDSTPTHCPSDISGGNECMPCHKSGLAITQWFRHSVKLATGLVLCIPSTRRSDFWSRMVTTDTSKWWCLSNMSSNFASHSLALPYYYHLIIAARQATKCIHMWPYTYMQRSYKLSTS